MTQIDPALTERQQYWLEHIRACDVAGKPSVQYARENGIEVSAMHSARKALTEKQARTGQLSPPERKAHRQQHAAPILDKLREWLDASLPTVPPSTLAGKALNYLHNEWPKLIRYLEDGRLEIDNNLAKNAIRPFVIGRKNWIFSDSVKGVKASANLYSLVESAKASGLEPYQYLRQVFTALPQAETVEDIEALLPWAVKKIPTEAL